MALALVSQGIGVFFARVFWLGFARFGVPSEDGIGIKDIVSIGALMTKWQGGGCYDATKIGGEKTVSWWTEVLMIAVMLAVTGMCRN